MGSMSLLSGKSRVQVGSNLPVLLAPFSGLNGAESTDYFKVNSRMLGKIYFVNLVDGDVEGRTDVRLSGAVAVWALAEWR